MTAPGDRSEPGPLFAVACEGADCLALVDAGGEPRGEVPVGSDPVHVETAAGRVFVATMGERSVSVVGPGNEVGRVETGVLGPAHVTRAGDRLLVPCTAGDAVAVIDPSGPSLEGRVPTGAEPHDVGVAGDLAVAGSRVDGVLTVFDPASRGVVATHGVPDPESARIQGVDGAGESASTGDQQAVAGEETDPSAGSGAVYAVDQGNDRLLLADGDGIRRTAPVGADPYEASVVGDRVYVPGRTSDTVHEFALDLTDPVVHRTAAGPEGVVAVDGDPWVFHRDAPVLRSLDGREVTLPGPSLAATPFRGECVLLSHYDGDAVSLVDTDSGAVAWTTGTPARPFGSLVV